MMLEKNNFILEYDSKLDYIPDVVNYLESKTSDIMSFFELDNLKNKRKIIIYTDLKLYKKHIENYYDYQDYMCADTNDGNINLLSLEEAHKTKEHRNMTIEDLKSTILHEFVHICQQDSQIERYDSDVIWFWEALATNLGNPEKFKRISIKSSNDQIIDFNSSPNNYSNAFTIGKYMLDKYCHEKILEFVKYPSKLLKESDKILNEAREWSYK